MTFSLAKRLVFTACIFSFICETAVQADPTPIPIPPGTILDCNALRVADYIDSLPVLPGSDLDYVINHLPINPEDFIEALDQMHPALLQDVTFATDENMQVFRQILTGRNAFLRHDRCLKFEHLYGNCNLGPYQMWITPFGVFNDQARIDCLHGYRSTTPGIMLGFDSQPNKNTAVGFGLGYSYTDLHWKDNYGDAHWHTGYFGAYATTISDCFYFDASVLGSYEFYKTNRYIHFSEYDDLFDDFYCNKEKCCEIDEEEDCCRKKPHPQRRRHRRHHKGGDRPRRPCGVERHAKNWYRGYAILSHLGLGLRFHVCGLQIIPFASIDYDFVDQDGHREYGARSLNLKVKSNQAHLLRSEAGLTLTSCIPYNCGWFRPSLTCSYVQKNILQGDRFVGAFNNYEDYKFNAYGTRKQQRYICPGFGLEMQFSSNWIMAFNYDADLSRKHVTQRATCRVGRAY